MLIYKEIVKILCIHNIFSTKFKNEATKKPLYHKIQRLEHYLKKTLFINRT